MNILVIEDEKLLAESLKELLIGKDFQVTLCYDGEAGLALGKSDAFDLILLDVMLPKRNGYEVARLLRMHRVSAPILMLTAKSELLDRVEGLNSGADYYLTKPFDSRELLACIQALLRRQGNDVMQMSYGNTTLDLSATALRCGENVLRLSAKEFEVMRLLFRTKENNISKEQILSSVWGYGSEAVENHVEVYVGFLRKKLKSIGSDITIVAARRLGYHLEKEAEIV